MLTASYRGMEFSRVGYYVSIDYVDAEMKENPPATPIFEKVGVLFNLLVIFYHWEKY
jgi:histone chaperone ASF1